VNSAFLEELILGSIPYGIMGARFFKFRNRVKKRPWIYGVLLKRLHCPVWKGCIFVIIGQVVAKLEPQFPPSDDLIQKGLGVFVHSPPPFSLALCLI